MYELQDTVTGGRLGRLSQGLSSEIVSIEKGLYRSRPDTAQIDVLEMAFGNEVRLDAQRLVRALMTGSLYVSEIFMH